MAVLVILHLMLMVWVLRGRLKSLNTRKGHQDRVSIIHITNNVIIAINSRDIVKQDMVSPLVKLRSVQ
jgi:hypothetical protein